MQEFTAEFKAIQKVLSKCWGKRASENNELSKLIEARKKIFGDIALGLSDEKEGDINKKIRELEGDIVDIDVTTSELERRQTLLKKSGSHIQEKVEIRED